MRDQIEAETDPGALFLDPARDPGIGFLSAPAYWWRLRDAAQVDAFSASGDDGMNDRIDAQVRQTLRHRRFARIPEFNVVPVLLTRAEFRKSYALAEGKFLLNGAAGSRLLNSFAWDGDAGEQTPSDALTRYFEACQAANDEARLRLATPPANCDFAIECRNTFNFFHFLTETLGQLCVLDDIGFTGRVFIHFPNHPDKTRAFVGQFIAALFPELAGRVFLERAPKSYGAVLSAFNFQLTYFQMPPSVIGSLDGLAPSDLSWHGGRATRTTRTVLSMNSVDRGLVLLRERALRAIEGRDFSHLPRRFYVARSAGQARSRQMKGEEALTGLLAAFGFEQICFEALQPLEQIALMARAEIMVSPHGAGFANMVFANPDATVIEIGTLQTLLIRWSDFWPLAHVSGCRYVSFIADHDSDDPMTVPDFNRDGLRPVHLTDRGLGRVTAFVAVLCGHVPKLTRAVDVARLAGQLMRSGHTDQARAVLDRHADLEGTSADLSLIRADLHKRNEEWGGEMIALHAAWRADPTRWQTLVQILWCARKAEKPEIQVWALRLLQADFPERSAEIAKGRDWIQQLL